MRLIPHTDYGKYEEAERILIGMLENDELTCHERPRVQYYLADVYFRVGRREECRDLLIRTAIQELQIPVRDYHAMCDLAVMFNDDKNYIIASDLISVATSDVIAINFYSRLRRAGSMQSLVEKAAYYSEHQRSRLSYYIVIIVCVALAIIRLGITKIPEIAEVLNCAVNTVYKYRETIRNKALCPKEDFEKIIKRIDF